MEMKAYSCRSTSLRLVRGGSNSSIGAGALPPLSAAFCAHKTRRINAIVALSERASTVTGRALRRLEDGGNLGEAVQMGVPDRLAVRSVGSIVAFTGVAGVAVVGTALLCMNRGVVEAIASQAGVGLITSKLSADHGKAATVGFLAERRGQAVAKCLEVVAP